jgi:hypothetical protein
MACTSGPTIVTNGLLLDLDAANPKSYPGAGTAWNDISGNANNATLTGSPTYSNTNAGIFSLNGTTAWIDCGNATIFSPPLLTASVMVRCVSFSTRPHLFGRGSGTSGNFYMVVETSGIFRFYNDIGANWVIAANTTAFPLNTWTYVTVTHDGTVSKIYYNGVQQAQGARVGSLRNWQSNTLQIGSILSGSSLINGNVAFAQLYDRALLDSEIQQNFNAVRGRYGI